MTHWTKEKEAGEPYPFARFNKKARVVTYTEEEYKKAIQPISSDWDKLETDVLFEMCERFNLRFIVIADRFSDEVKDRIDLLECQNDQTLNHKQRTRKREIKAATKNAVKDRTVDELKARYYSVAKEVLTMRGETDNAIVKKPFNFEMEVRRKNNLEKIYMRTRT